MVFFHAVTSEFVQNCNSISSSLAKIQTETERGRERERWPGEIMVPLQFFFFSKFSPSPLISLCFPLDKMHNWSFAKERVIARQSGCGCLVGEAGREPLPLSGLPARGHLDVIWGPSREEWENKKLRRGADELRQGDTSAPTPSLAPRPALAVLEHLRHTTEGKEGKSTGNEG